MNRITRVGTALLSVAVAGSLAACSQAAETGGAVTLKYWLWDDYRKASYQQCADAFKAANPNITIEITQSAWARGPVRVHRRRAPGRLHRPGGAYPLAELSHDQVDA